MTEMPIFRDMWSEPHYSGAPAGLDAMLHDFEIKPEAVEGAEILFARYTAEGYEGSAYVLFQRDGKLFEVSGAHCSCYGLENQWDPEEVPAEALRHRLEKGEYFEAIDAKDDLLAILDEFEGNPADMPAEPRSVAQQATDLAGEGRVWTTEQDIGT